MRVVIKQIFILLIPLLAFNVPVTKNSTSQKPEPSRQNTGVDQIMKMPDNRAKLDSIISFVSKNRKDTAVEQLFREGLRITREQKLLIYDALILNAYGVFKRDLSDYSTALKFHTQALEIAREQKIDSIQMFALNNIGVVFRRLDQNNEALNYHMEALKIAEKIKHDFSVSVSLNSIGNIHTALGNYKDAIEYFKKALPIAEKAQNFLGIAMNLGNIGECYYLQSQLDSAKKYYTLSLDYNKKLSNEKDRMKGIAICYGSLGNIYKEVGDLGKARFLFRESLDINKQLGDKMFISQSYNFLGDTYLRGNSLNPALNMFNEALSIAKEIGSKTEIRSAFAGLMKVYEGKGDYHKALNFSNQVKQYTDSIYMESSNLHMKLVEAIYQSESEQSKIKLLETTRQNDRLMMIGSLILFALLLIAGLLYYLRNRLIERNTRLQRELEIRTQIASDLHDDMGSSLSSIHIFSELLRKQDHKSEELLNKIEENAKETLDALDDIIWLVKPSNDKFSNLSMHIGQYAVPLFEGKNINAQIDFPDWISETPLPMESRRNIFLIIKESINNLIKYSDCTEALVKAEYVNDDILFTVKDNGKGFNPEMLTTRNGLKNLKARAGQINAVLNIQSAPGEGTLITLLVKAKNLVGG